MKRRPRRQLTSDEYWARSERRWLCSILTCVIAGTIMVLGVVGMIIWSLSRA